MGAVMARVRGDGAIFQRANGLWVGRVELPAGPEGRRRKEVTATTLDRLHSKLDKIREQYYIHGDLPTGSHTIEQWMTYWLDNIAQGRVRPNTLAGYRSVSKQIIAAIGTVRLNKLQPAHVRRMHDHVKKTNTSTYALNAHRVLSRALKDAQAEGIIHRNVAAVIDAPRKTRTNLNALTVDEAIEVIKRAKPELEGTTQRYDASPARWATYLLTGARRGEVIGLEWERITSYREKDRETGETVTLWQIDLSWQLQRITDITTAPDDYEYRRIRGSQYWTRPKTAAGTRIIPLVQPLLGILMGHRERAGENAFGLVFVNDDGLPIDPDTETDHWMRTAATVTDKRVRLHDLRHTTVDLLLEAGVEEDVVMEIVGHADRAVTRGYKSKTKLSRRTDAMRALSTSLGFDQSSSSS
jgi:integrase